MPLCELPYECFGEILGISLRHLAWWMMIGSVVFSTIVVGAFRYLGKRKP